jgi:hypothetical protein
MTKPLSPAAQAVMDAYNSGFDRPVAVHHKPRIAAVLRELTDHVAPVRAWHESTNDMEWQRHQMTVIINNRILAIAAELEGH